MGVIRSSRSWLCYRDRFASDSEFDAGRIALSHSTVHHSILLSAFLTACVNSINGIRLQTLRLAHTGKRYSCTRFGFQIYSEASRSLDLTMYGDESRDYRFPSGLSEQHGSPIPRFLAVECFESASQCFFLRVGGCFWGAEVRRTRTAAKDVLCCTTLSRCTINWLHMRWSGVL